MLRFLFAQALLLCLFCSFTFAQTVPGALKGKVTTNGESTPDVKVVVKRNQVFISGAATNGNGEYRIENLDSGTYNVRFSSIDTTITRPVTITSGMTSELNVDLGTEGGGSTKLAVVEIGAPRPQNIERRKASASITKHKSLKDIRSGDSRYISGWKKTVEIGGVTRTRDGGFNVRGGRADKSTTFVDGVRVIGAPSTPTKPTVPPQEPIGNEEYEKTEEQAFTATATKDTTTFSIDVDRASYANIRRMIENGQTVPPEAVRIEELINYFDYHSFQNVQGEHPFTLYSEVSECPWNPKHRLLHLSLQAKKIEKEALPPSSLVFLVDVSGSMQQPNKLPLVQQSLKMLLKELRPQDQVAIVVYAGSEGVALPMTSCSKKQVIEDAIDNLSAGGGTAGAAGITLAYKIAEQHLLPKGNNRVILATDGDFNIGISNDADLVKLIEDKRKTGIYLSVLGFGMGNYKDGKMEKLSNAGNGNYAYIDTELEARKTLVKEFGATMQTVATDVKMQMIFDKSRIKTYRLIGYDNRILQNADFENDQKDAGDMGSGHTVTALYELELADSSGNVVAQKNTPSIAKMRIRYKSAVGEASKAVEYTVFDNETPLSATSEDFRFSASVATFGLILRQSKYKGNASYDLALNLANTALGKDTDGYRKDYLKLVNKCKK